MTPKEKDLLRHELSRAMMEFVTQLNRHINKMDDEQSRRAATQRYRSVVHSIAARGVEVALSWHVLAVWTEIGKERIGYFARALECRRAEALDNPPTKPLEIWSDLNMQGECLFEIGRVHAHEGAPEAARRFFEEALPLARRADEMQEEAGVRANSLEGRILSLLLQLPDEATENG